jgi:hypothetical protein
MLNPQFAHVAMTRPDNPRGKREGQRRPVLDQKLDNPADVDLFVFVQIEEPPGELVGSLNLPGHG